MHSLKGLLQTFIKHGGDRTRVPKLRTLGQCEFLTLSCERELHAVTLERRAWKGKGDFTTRTRAKSDKPRLWDVLQVP